MKMKLTEELASQRLIFFQAKNTVWEESLIFEFALIEKASLRVNLTLLKDNSELSLASRQFTVGAN